MLLWRSSKNNRYVGGWYSITQNSKRNVDVFVWASDRLKYQRIKRSFKVMQHYHTRQKKKKSYCLQITLKNGDCGLCFPRLLQTPPPTVCFYNVHSRSVNVATSIPRALCMSSDQADEQDIPQISTISYWTGVIAYSGTGNDVKKTAVITVITQCKTEHEWNSSCNDCPGVFHFSQLLRRRSVAGYLLFQHHFTLMLINVINLGMH